MACCSSQRRKLMVEKYPCFHIHLKSSNFILGFGVKMWNEIDSNAATFMALCLPCVAHSKDPTSLKNSVPQTVPNKTIFVSRECVNTRALHIPFTFTYYLVEKWRLMPHFIDCPCESSQWRGGSVAEQGDQMSLKKKIVQNVHQPIFCHKVIHRLYLGLEIPKMRYFCN
jgi:hypothetical protein